MLGLIPRPIARIYFTVSGDGEGRGQECGREGGEESEGEGDEEGEMIRQLEEMLDVFGHTYLNKHLVYGVLELVLVRLVPEMAERTSSELLGERGVVLRRQEGAGAVGEGEKRKEEKEVR